MSEATSRHHEDQHNKHYDIVIIGGGASGLMLAANLNLHKLRTSTASDASTAKGIILEGSPNPGSKLLMSGGGHCNISHGGSIKEFLNAYGSKGQLLRRCLYKHSNLELASWLDSHGVPLADESGEIINLDYGSRAFDGVRRIFPASMKAYDVLDALTRAAEDNGWEIKTDAKVTGVTEVQSAVSAASFPPVHPIECAVDCPHVNSADQWKITFNNRSAAESDICSRSTESVIQRGSFGSDTISESAGSGNHSVKSRPDTINRSVESDKRSGSSRPDALNGYAGSGSHSVKSRPDALSDSAGSGKHSRSSKSESCRRTDPVSNICSTEHIIYASSVVIASGGITYPETGSDGSMFAILKNLGVNITGLRSALAQIYVRNYPYAELSGISIPDVTVTAYSQNAACTCSGKAARFRGDVLFTHKGLSGPAILNISGSAEKGEVVRLSYNKDFDKLPKRMQRVLENRSRGSSGNIRTKTLASLMDHDDFIVERIDPHGMVTAGGVSLDEIDMKTMQVKRFCSSSGTPEPARNSVAALAAYAGLTELSEAALAVTADSADSSRPQNIKKARSAAEHRNTGSMYVIGEALDADGITGGYNLQLCWSTALTAADSLNAGFTQTYEI